MLEGLLIVNIVYVCLLMPLRGKDFQQLNFRQQRRVRKSFMKYRNTRKGRKNPYMTEEEYLPILQKQGLTYLITAIIILPVYVFAIFALYTPMITNIASQSNPKEFSKAGMTITLTDAFQEKELAAYAAYYESKTALVFVVKEDFSVFEQAGIPTDISLQEYAKIVAEANNSDWNIKEKDGFTCFEFDENKNGKDYSYFAVVLRGNDAYWLIQFACETKNYSHFSEDFMKWAKSVKV